MWDDLLRAVALMLVIEGVMPFLSPSRFRRSLLNFASLEDRWMRLIGLLTMVAGLVCLQVIAG
jgi:uncharacterized protein YjeT (DUF2065 family)